MITAYLPLLVQGTAMSMLSWLLAGCASICIGTVLAILSCKYAQYTYAARAIACYTFIAKGVPVYVQILIAYFVLPSMLGINLSPFIAGNLALAFCSSGYVTEIIKSGFNAIPEGQWQAACVLGYSPAQAMKRIMLPQALKIVLPTLFGELEQLLKSSSLLATIGILELTRSGMNIISRELNPIPVYLSVAAIYLLFSAVLVCIKTIVIKRNAYGY
jgi:His/Glu/Gln/Arg/opine family amino acid ABC transporter permease subunit